MEIPYLEHFGFSEKPFGMSPDPSFYYESTEHKQAIDYLSFFIAQQEGFALIYGDVGSGKTTVSRIFLNSLDKETYNTALILNPVTDEAEFMKEVLREFCVQNIPENKKELYDTLRHYLLEEFQKGKVNILIIDEAQLLSYDLLEFVRLLSNIETDKQKILHTVFFAQPEFLDKLKDPLMRHLAQRITVTYCIAPLTYAEVKAYINYRLFKAGAKGPLEFQDRAMKLIHTASRGYPRLINYICDRCLLVLYSRSSFTVDSHVVSKVIIEESIPLSTAKHVEGTNKFGLLRYAPMAAGILVLILVGIAGYYLVFSGTLNFFAMKKPSQPQVSVAQSAPPPAAPQNKPSPALQGQGVQTPAETGGATPAAAPPAKINADVPARVPPKKTALSKKVVVNKEAANVRAEPDINSARIGVIVKDEVLKVTGEKTDQGKLKWYRITLYEGREGWIAETVVSEKR